MKLGELKEIVSTLMTAFVTFITKQKELQETVDKHSIMLVVLTEKYRTLKAQMKEDEVSSESESELESETETESDGDMSIDIESETDSESGCCKRSRTE